MTMRSDKRDTTADEKVSNGQVVNNELEPSVTPGKSNEQKTWFDWTEAILLPLVLALLGAGFTAVQFIITSEQQKADGVAKDIETKEQVLTDYSKTISELVTKDKLGNENYESVKNIARGQTLIALRRLDSGDESKDDTGKLKGLLIRYLYDAQLIGYDYGTDGSHKKLPVIDLRQANLNNLVLEDAWLLNIDLSGTELNNGNFKNADLKDADLRDADLRDADLTAADLRDANLRDADLRDADLTAADLRDANLRDASLGNAEFTNEIIKQACYWEKAIYIDMEYAELYGAVEKNSKEDEQRQKNIKQNQEIIDEMKQDKASDPKIKVDCSKW